MSDKTTEVLTAARDIIADKDHWCRGEEARDENGEPVPPRSDEAVKWCAVGALERACGDSPIDVLVEACNAIEADMVVPLDDFNDSFPHDQVVAAFDKTIERIGAT